MLEAYRSVFTAATAAFSLTGVVARLPISMMGLGIVLLAEHETGSYGFAGAVSATAMIANAVFAIPQGRLLDRVGQGRVLPALTAVWGAALALGIWSLTAGWPALTTYLSAAVAGACLPAVGTCVRARWSHALAERPGRLHTAFSFEAVADEAVFMVGPISVTLLATLVHPAAGLVAALSAGVVGTLVFASLRGTEPPAHPRPTLRGDRAPIPWRAIGPLTVVTAALGVLFGSAEVVTVAFADEQGTQGAAGFLLAVWALGSLLAGLVSGAITWRRGPAVRLRWGAVALCVAVAPLPLVGTLPVMALVLLVGGLAISPTLIAAMSLAERVLPTSRMTEGMAVLHTGMAAGLAPGAALAGLVIDARGASTAYLVCLAGTLVALAAALLVAVPATVRAHEERAEGPAGHVA